MTLGTCAYQPLSKGSVSCTAFEVGPEQVGRRVAGEWVCTCTEICSL